MAAILRSTKLRVTLLALGAACVLAASDYGKECVQVSKTEKMDFPAGGTLRLEHSTGDLTIEGWDEPGIELTTTTTSKDGFGAADRETEKKELERVQVTAKRNGNELVIVTEYPHHRAFPWVEPLSVATNFNQTYTIKVPRNAKLVIRHDDGEVHVNDVAGNVEVKARQGMIELRVNAENAPPMIEAKSFIGSVSSDFDGKETGQPLHFGHSFSEGATGAPQKLNLKIGYGDIVILKAHEPKEPPPSS